MQYTRESSRFDRQASHSSRYGTPRPYWGNYRDNCTVCGEEFHSKSPFSKYCSQRCANDAAMAKRKARVTERKAQADKCVVCGKAIEQNNWTKVRRYCSPACKQRAYRISKQESPDC